MTIFFRGSLVVFACLVLGVTAYGQKRSDDSAGVAVLKGTGKAGVIVVGSAAKGAWVVTKATGKYVALPVAKTIFVKAAPAVAKFALKTSAKHLLPVAVKVAAL